MGDIVDGVVTGHLLLLKEVGSMAFPFRKDGDKHIRARHFVTVGRLNMDHSTLDHPLESGCRFGILIIAGDEIVQLAVNIVSNDMLEIIQINIAGAHHGASVLIVDQRKQKMFEGGIFVVPLVCDGEGLMQRPFKAGENDGI